MDYDVLKLFAETKTLDTLDNHIWSKPQLQ